MIYYIILLIILAYLVGVIIASVIDKRLVDSMSKLQSQDITVNIPQKQLNNIMNNDVEEHFTQKSNDDGKEDNNIQNVKDTIENFDGKFTLTKTIDDIKPKIDIKDDKICYENHLHNKCLRGRMNYGDPYMMAPIDRKYFKYNYQPNMRLQDYINWLWMYDNSEEELPYIHLKNLYRLKKGEKLKHNYGILPPVDNTIIPKSTEDYFNIMYNTGEVNINSPITLSHGYDAYNYNEYPSIKT